MDKRLANKMLGETVIYSDSNMDYHPAMIINIHSETMVDLLVWNTTISAGGSIQTSVPVNTEPHDMANVWWRRIKF